MVVGRKVKGPAVQDPSEGADGQKPQVKGALLCHADAKTTPTIDIFGAFWRDQNIYIYTLYVYIYVCVCMYIYICISSNTGWFGRDKTKFGDKKVIIPVDVPGASWVSTVGDLEHQPPSWGSPTMVVVMVTITIITLMIILIIIIIILCIKQSDNIRYMFLIHFDLQIIMIDAQTL